MSILQFVTVLRFFIRLLVVLSIMEDVRRSHTVISVRGPLVDVSILQFVTVLRFFIRLLVVLSIMEDVRRSHTVISVRGPLVDVFFSSSGS